ncbi:MAG: hypothetical protein AB8B62_00780 [Roseobacter sp.]
MQGKPDSDMDRFMRAIAVFSAAPERVTPLGRLLPKPSEGALYAVLNEINETVLRRKLTLTQGGDVTLVLDVGERRVLMVLETPPSASAYHAATTGRNLGENDVGLLLRVIEAMCADDAEIYITTHLPDPGTPAVFDGVSARMLHDQIEKTRPADMPSHLAAGLDACRAHAIAIVAAKNGDAFSTWGDEDACARFAKIAFDRPGNPEDDVKVSLWHGAFEDGQAVIRADVQGIVIFVLCAPNALLSCFTLWKETLFEQGDG